MSRSKPVSFSLFKPYPQLVAAVSTKDWGDMAVKYSLKAEVKANRRRLAEALGIDDKKIFECQQVHGTRIVVLDSKNIKKFEKERVVPNCDGLITNLPDVFLLIKTADCLPILVFDPEKQVVAAVHAGWRGVIGKIFWLAVLKMQRFFGSKTENLRVAIGPSVRGCCFVHPSLIQSKLPEWQSFIKEVGGQKSVDLLSFVKDQLEQTGVKKENIEAVEECTVCYFRWFSHFASLRGAKDKKGFFASLIGLRREK